MEITGEVTSIIYRNEINSYTVADIEDDEGNEITIVGYLPFVSEGDSLLLKGRYVSHKDYGRQFKVETFEKEMPQTDAALEKYLASGNIKGIGKATAKKIIERFGQDTIRIFQNEPLKLAEIKGISKDKAIEMSESFVSKWEVWQIVGFLGKFGIGVEYAKKVYDKFGTEAIEKIKADPYVLVDLAKNVDFKQIDKMALELGISYDNQNRVESGIKYSLMLGTYSGHSCIVKDNLIEFVINLLDVSTENIEDGLIDLSAKKQIVTEERDGIEYIYLYNFYEIEEEIAVRIKRLQTSKNVKKIEKIKEKLRHIEKNSKIELSDKQIEALELVNNNNVTIITGGPGTGKTTIIKNIIELYEQNKKKVILAAPTGRAAKRMTETTGKEASTLHRLLEIGKIDDNNLFQNSIEFEGAPIDADVIIVDEVSMVDMFVMRCLLKCIYRGTKLVLVGDVDQLASVGPGAVLKDMINSEKIATIRLDKIFRQAAKSKIILNAHRVNNGENFISKDEIQDETEEDFFFIKKKSQEEMLAEVISLCTGRLKKYGNYDFFEHIQVLSPTKKGMLGTRELNKILQEKLNPNIRNLPERKVLGVTFRIGDRVMQTTNNYDIEWEKDSYMNIQSNTNEIGSGIFNGEIGTIIDVDKYDKDIKVQFDDDKIATYNSQDIDQIEHSYAITIHKAQGSEFDVVIMVIPPTSPMLLTRNLLYTGITRAKKLLIIISSENVVNYMIQNVDSKKRNTGLEYKLREIL